MLALLYRQRPQFPSRAAYRHAAALPYSAQAAVGSAPAAKVHCYISRCTDPYTNLAFEDWILRQSDPRSYILYLWRNRPTIVIGRNQNPWKECNLDMMAERDVLLARRSSGGGTVYHDLGNTNYTVVMPRDAFTRDRCAQMVADALQHEDIPAYVNARHDVTVDGLKISGSAFKLTSKRAFHHGTMLIDADLSRLRGCLDSKSKHIEAKGVDSVRSKVANLRDYSWSIDHSTFCNAVMRKFRSAFGDLDEENVTVWGEDDAEVVALVQKERARIQTWEWLYGQTPEFVHRLPRFSFSWAAVTGKIISRHGYITSVELSTGNDMPQPSANTHKMLSDACQLLKGARYDRSDIQDRLSPLFADARAQELCEWLLRQI